MSKLAGFSDLNRTEQRLYDEIKLKIELLDSIKYRREYFLRYEEFYVQEINTKLSSFDIELIIYDEIEYFYQWSND